MGPGCRQSRGEEATQLPTAKRPVAESPQQELPPIAGRRHKFQNPNAIMLLPQAVPPRWSCIISQECENVELWTRPVSYQMLGRVKRRRTMLRKTYVWSEGCCSSCADVTSGSSSCSAGTNAQNLSCGSVCVARRKMLRRLLFRILFLLSPTVQIMLRRNQCTICHVTSCA